MTNPFKCKNCNHMMHKAFCKQRVMRYLGQNPNDPSDDGVIEDVCDCRNPEPEVPQSYKTGKGDYGG